MSEGKVRKQSCQTRNGFGYRMENHKGDTLCPLPPPPPPPVGIGLWEMILFILCTLVNGYARLSLCWTSVLIGCLMISSQMHCIHMLLSLKHNERRSLARTIFRGIFWAGWESSATGQNFERTICFANLTELGCNPTLFLGLKSFRHSYVDFFWEGDRIIWADYFFFFQITTHGPE